MEKETAGGQNKWRETQEEEEEEKQHRCVQRRSAEEEEKLATLDAFTVCECAVSYS